MICGSNQIWLIRRLISICLVQIESDTYFIARIAISNATKVAPFANGDLGGWTLSPLAKNRIKGSVHLIRVGPKPPVKPFHPCLCQTFLAQSTKPVYSLFVGSNESVCSLLLITSIGYIL